MIKRIVFALLIVSLVVSCTQKQPVKIACIGDSITECIEMYNYPIQLDSILGPGYNVLNCGRSSATLLKLSETPIWGCTEFYNAFAFEPDIITIKLGTNDSKPENWNEEVFLQDLQAMVDTLRTIPSNPKIYFCLPVPAYNHAWGISDSVIRNGVIPSIQKIALQNNLQVIDLYKPLSNHIEFFPDSIHPNKVGARAIAEIIAKELKISLPN